MPIQSCLFRIVARTRWLPAAVLVAIAILSPSVLAQSKPEAVSRYLWDWLALGEGPKTLMRYGNWLGEGWWGGSELPGRVGTLPPVDDLDAIAQRHDFGYELAEALGKGRPDLEAYYMAMADAIAVRETLAHSRDPST